MVVLKYWFGFVYFYYFFSLILFLVCIYGCVLAIFGRVFFSSNFTYRICITYAMPFSISKEFISLRNILSLSRARVSLCRGVRSWHKESISCILCQFVFSARIFSIKFCTFFTNSDLLPNSDFSSNSELIFPIFSNFRTFFLILNYLLKFWTFLTIFLFPIVIFFKFWELWFSLEIMWA